MLHAMGFDEIVAQDMVILGRPETVAETILRLAGQLDLMGLAMIFKLGAMPYDMVERSMTAIWRGGDAEDTAGSRSRWRRGAARCMRRPAATP